MPTTFSTFRYPVARRGSLRTRRRVEPQPARRIEQTRLRLQALLADRFQLRFHRETREVPVYTLVLGKGGAKLEENRETAVTGGVITYNDRLMAGAPRCRIS